jgi:hypothetical protein
MLPELRVGCTESIGYEGAQDTEIRMVPEATGDDEMNKRLKGTQVHQMGPAPSLSSKTTSHSNP